MKKIFIISGPTGAGKSSVVRGVLEEAPLLELSVSCTTREPRSNEIHGRDYYFISKEQFEGRIQNNKFLEWAIVHGEHRYGTLNSEIERIEKIGKVPLLEIDVQGARNLTEKLACVTTIFIKPESVEELIERVHRRGYMTEAELQHRLQSLVRENEESKHYNYCVVNKNGALNHTVARVAEIIRKELGLD